MNPLETHKHMYAYKSLCILYNSDLIHTNSEYIVVPVTVMVIC